jgi:subtilisin family serine protease
LNDPEWNNQWYINDGCPQGYSLNITSAWEMGFTGRNVVVSIIDDGLEMNNPELTDNYDAEASHDFNDDDVNPLPRYERTNENKHGTRFFIFFFLS